MPGVARPVRMLASSPCRCTSDRSICLRAGRHAREGSGEGVEVREEAAYKWKHWVPFTALC